MSDAHDHDHGDHGHDDEGGHEIDRMPNARLFNLLFGLSALTLLSCIGVIQLFNMQVDALEHSRAEQGSFRIAEYTDEMNKAKSGWGKVEIKELDDKNTTNVRYYMPVASAKKAMLEEPKLLEALPPSPGWKTADDRAPAAVPSKPTAPPDGAGMRPPTPPQQPAPEGGAAKPPEPSPPADKPPGDAPPPKGDDAKGDDGKGEGKADEKPAPPKPKPAPRKPAPEPTDAPPSPDGAP